MVDVDAVVADTFRQEWGRVVATLIRMTGDWDLAEECAQEAFAQALARWPGDGVPRRPGACIVTAARNRAVDRLRRRSVETAKLREIAAVVDPGEDADPSGIADDRLRLLFTCCHPALSLEARVALTLRTLAGLSTAEIARSFLVSEATMAKRLVRRRARSVTPESLTAYRRSTNFRRGRPAYSRCCISCSTRATRPRPAPT